MTLPAVATHVHQALDAHRHFATKVAFDCKLRDFTAKLVEFAFRQGLDLNGGADLRGLANLASAGRADSVDRLQRDHGVLVGLDIDARNTCHRKPRYLCQRRMEPQSIPD